MMGIEKDEYDNEFADGYSDPYEDSRSTSLSCIVWPQDDIGGLYLGNIEGARNVKELKKRGITAVLTVAAGIKLKYEKQDIANHMIIEADDVAWYDLAKEFERAIEFIEKHIETGNVYVHCFAGVSRSSTIVIAYLMKARRKSLTEIAKYVKSKRSVVSPNTGFYRQLMDFEKKLLSAIKK